MKQLSLILAALMFVSAITPTIALADTPDTCVTPLSVSNPCVGVLLPPEAAAKGLKCLQIELPKLHLNIEQEKALFKNYREYMTTVLKTERSHASSLRGLLDTALEVPKQTTAWYEHPVFWFSVGFVVATATTVGITYAVNDK